MFKISVCINQGTLKSLKMCKYADYKFFSHKSSMCDKTLTLEVVNRKPKFYHLKEENYNFSRFVTPNDEWSSWRAHFDVVGKHAMPTFLIAVY